MQNRISIGVSKASTFAFDRFTSRPTGQRLRAAQRRPCATLSRTLDQLGLQLPKSDQLTWLSQTGLTWLSRTGFARLAKQTVMAFRCEYKSICCEGRTRFLDSADKHPAASFARLSAFCSLPSSLAPKQNVVVKVRLASSAQHSQGNAQFSSFGTSNQARLFATCTRHRSQCQGQNLRSVFASLR